MNEDFDSSTYLSQVRKLRFLATEALKEYDLKSYEIKFINHGENTTYKIVTKKQNYLLRIHCRSHRTKAAFIEELKWLDSLSRKTNIPVQKPIRSKNGDLIVKINNLKIGHPRYCDLLEWQDGYIKNNKNPKTFFEVGKLIGELQKNSMKSKYRNYWDTEGLIGKNATLGGISALATEYPKHIAELESLRKTLYKKVKAYENRNKDRLSLIHGDLHFGNMIWNKGVVQPIDFDDCGYGLEMYDLAVTLTQSGNFFKRIGKEQSSRCKEELLKGYMIYKNLSDDDIEILPYLVAVRGVAMLGWLHERSDNPELKTHLQKNISQNMEKIQKYFKQAQLKSYF